MGRRKVYLKHNYSVVFFKAGTKTNIVSLACKEQFFFKKLKSLKRKNFQKNMSYTAKEKKLFSKYTKKLFYSIPKVAHR